jgi:hypothetical protein
VTLGEHHHTRMVPSLLLIGVCSSSSVEIGNQENNREIEEIEWDTRAEEDQTHTKSVPMDPPLFEIRVCVCASASASKFKENKENRESNGIKA